MEVSGVQGNHLVRPVSSAQDRSAGAGSPGESVASDRRDSVELSEVGRWLSHLQQLPSIRSDKVNQARSQIEAGEYLTDAKLNAAVDKLLEDLGI
jgi:anti-sigma28 factor (negative regulator of flagellin synthesis)